MPTKIRVSGENNQVAGRDYVEIHHYSQREKKSEAPKYIVIAFLILATTHILLKSIGLDTGELSGVFVLFAAIFVGVRWPAIKEFLQSKK